MAWLEWTWNENLHVYLLRLTPMPAMQFSGLYKFSKTQFMSKQICESNKSSVASTNWSLVSFFTRRKATKNENLKTWKPSTITTHTMRSTLGRQQCSASVVVRFFMFKLKFHYAICTLDMCGETKPVFLNILKPIWPGLIRERQKARKHSDGIQKCMGKSLKVHEKFSGACIIEKSIQMFVKCK